jgi:hypothetical protein
VRRLDVQGADEVGAQIGHQAPERAERARQQRDDDARDADLARQQET